MVDAADKEKIEASRNELHNLLDKPQLQGIPVSYKKRNKIKTPTGLRREESFQMSSSELLRSDAALNIYLLFVLSLRF